ncbi:hypothetical protein [Streptomyces thermolilacinus]|uniref:Uncharacterized protein n=1 Tax=Streptomyces thermolilacinus SPC6 TaxID=1306406 RepID=A0A1D3DLJ5_9ACTN|nr:hypothetical protein [Streptomyces thermolilacinus]OEJ93195.1 hypothetical protein J116_000530 [Streptomyces thermolilacinus SPC6]
MSTGVSGMIECGPGARLRGPDDDDSRWQGAIDLFLLNNGNAYDALACLFGVRDSYGFEPLAEGRGLPQDTSDAVRADFDADGGPRDVHGTTWIAWAELAAADWQATDRSGTWSRESVAGDGPLWYPEPGVGRGGRNALGAGRSVMRTLSGLHGPENVRLVVWFH